MISRYTRPEFGQIWTDHHRYKVWLQVELAVSEEFAREGMIPAKDWQVLRKKVTALLEKGGVDPARVDAHEKVTKHDVIAFTTAVAEKIGPISRYIHFGLTSSDVVDTALSLLTVNAGEALLADIAELLKTLRNLAKKYQKLPTIGRSHGIFAEPTSFGLKFLGWYAEWQRNETRLRLAIDQMRVGKLSGAVGVNSHITPQFETRVLKRLGLKREPVSTQVVPRDRHAEFLNAVALCGSSLERIAVELRHLQRSEVAEVMEGFSVGQKGSSAMPHKRNPISSENLTGISRLLRGYAMASLENVALWHERDISHSSVERVNFPDATILLDYALNRMNGILKNLVVREENVRKNLAAAGEVSFSGHFLLALVNAGVTRENAYAWVQSCAMQAMDQKRSFLELLAQHPDISKNLKPREIKHLGSIDYQLRNVAKIYQETLD